MSSMGDILQIMREQGGVDNPTVYLLGAVEQTEPLRISAGGLTLDREDLLMAHWPGAGTGSGSSKAAL